MPANPQLENGHVKIANELWEAICKIRIPGEARQIFDVVIRKTYGFNKKEDWISLSQFEKYTGLKKSNICRSINKLLSMKVLSKKITIIKKDNDYDGELITYSIQKDYTIWQPLSKKITLSKKIMPVIKKDNASLSKKIPTKDNTTKDTITKDKIYTSKESEILTKWNEFADRNGLSRVIELSTKRKRAISSRLKESAFDIDILLEQIKQSDFLLGKSVGSTWKIGFDWLFTSANNYLKILEGNYNGKSGKDIGGAKTSAGKWDNFFAANKQ